VQVEHVHDRPLPPARAVGGAEILDERRGGVRRPLRVRVVLAARRKPAADDVHVLVDGLQRVVGRREKPEVRGRGRVGPVRRELRHPEEVQVRLVADDHVTHLWDLARDRRGVRREADAVLAGERCVAAELVDRDDRTDAGAVGRLGGTAQRVQLRRRRRIERRLPDRAEHERLESRARGEPDLGVRVTRLGRVIDRADEERRRLRAGAAAASGEERGGERRGREVPDHPGDSRPGAQTRNRRREPPAGTPATCPFRPCPASEAEPWPEPPWPRGTVPLDLQALCPKRTCPSL
jgi:hypothetical protein